jgi:hypothetical protein
MFSLSARFSRAPEVLRLTNRNRYRLGKFFSEKAHRVLEDMTRDGDAVSPIELKAAYLLTYHDLTCLPSREGAQQCAKLVRMAYMCRLHQLDNATVSMSTNNNNSQNSAIELEENRCLWWGIFSLDCFCSLTSFVPSNIEDLSIATCLPSSVITNLTAVDLPLPKGGFLDDESATFWPTTQNQFSTGSGVQSLLLHVINLSREMTTARRLYYENSRCNLTPNLEQLKQNWKLLFTNVPSWVFDPEYHEFDGNAARHRKRLETLNMIYM